MYVYVTREMLIVLLQVGIWIDAGSRYENDKNNGVAHFLEHMAFKVRETKFNYSGRAKIYFAI